MTGPEHRSLVFLFVCQQLEESTHLVGLGDREASFDRAGLRHAQTHSTKVELANKVGRRPYVGLSCRLIETTSMWGKAVAVR
jgi:hypothetical protein